MQSQVQRHETAWPVQRMAHKQGMARTKEPLVEISGVLSQDT